MERRGTASGLASNLLIFCWLGKLLCRSRVREVLPPRSSPEPNADARQTLRTPRCGRHAGAKPSKLLYMLPLTWKTRIRGVEVRRWRTETRPRAPHALHKVARRLIDIEEHELRLPRMWCHMWLPAKAVSTTRRSSLSWATWCDACGGSKASGRQETNPVMPRRCISYCYLMLIMHSNFASLA